MNPSIPLENQLLSTKFYIPMTSGPLISRPRLTTLLNESLQYPLTLVSAAAGFGKTTLLSTWSQSLPTGNPRIAWVSLDEEDNEPRLFWTYVLTTLHKQLPERFSSLLTLLQSPQSPPLNYLLAELINLLVEGTETFLLILDDYQVITERQVHTTFAYLIEHLPAQLRIIVATRADPPLPLAHLRARKQVLEVRTNQLCCTLEETKAFLDEVMGLSLSEETIQEITTRTEGWLVGLQLLGLSLPDQINPEKLLKEISGDQRYILDYLTEEVLRRQPQEVQTFLLSTSILDERLTASLCDTVMEQTGSQQMLQRLEQTNLFVVSLDSRRQWYRYHALFAEALRYRLGQTYGDLVLTLHHRASIWYAEHDQTTQAILHAFGAKEWQWAADLIERKSFQLLSFNWGASQHKLVIVQQWLKQLPIEVVASRPRLCLACTQLLWAVAPPTMLQAWLDTAEAMLKASLTSNPSSNTSYPMPNPQMQKKQEDLLGQVIATRSYLLSYQEEDGQAVLSLCQQALALLSVENSMARALVARAQHRVYYVSSANDAVAAVKSGLEAVSLAQTAGHMSLAISLMGATANLMIGAGRLHEVYRLGQQAFQMGRQPGGLLLPDVGYPAASQAEILREWNQVDAALSLVEEAISLCRQAASLGSFVYSLYGYAVQLRIYLSCGELGAASASFEEFECLGLSMNKPIFLHFCSLFTTIDQIRLWLACGNLERAIRWAEELDIREQHSTSFGLEREEVARIRVLLATGRPTLALERLEPVIQRVVTGKRWGHVIEVRLLQALAYQMCQQEMQALDALSEAIRLGELEGYIRSFMDEGAPMETLLYRLRKRNRKSGPTPYLDTLLAAFQQESTVHAQAGEPTKVQPLPEPLSERELQVLQLLARGESNLEIAQELVIVIDTVKRHVSHIFSKLGVQNRVQAVRQARELGLLNDER